MKRDTSFHNTIPGRLLCSFLLPVMLFLSGCTGISETQLAMDPVYAETERLNKVISLHRAEFNQLKNEYLLTNHEAHLYRMNELIKQMRIELDFASYFTKYYKYYRKGLDYQRWRSAGDTYGLGRMTLCQMLLETGEIHLLYADQQKAAELFTTVLSEFDEDEFSMQVQSARKMLNEVVHILSAAIEEF